jgi:hypothetical protein
MITSEYPLQRGESIDPVFIIGCGRSGTTLLRRVLVETEQLHIPPETFVLGKALKRFRRNATRSWEELVRIVLTKFEKDKHFPRLGLAIAPMIEELGTLPPDQRSAAAIIHVFYRSHAESIGYPTARWGEKSPANTYHLDAINDVFPRARYIHIVRNGFDVVASLLNMGRYDLLEDAALRWLTATEAARRFGAEHPEAVIEIRYEELVTRTRDTALQLCDFLGIRFTEEMLTSSSWISTQEDMRLLHHQRVLQPITSSRISSSRERFQDRELIRLQSLIGPRLEELGYEPSFS